MKTNYLKYFLVLIASIAISTTYAQSLTESQVRSMLKEIQAVTTVQELNQEFTLSSGYTDDNTGISYIYLQQTYGGKKVYNAIKTIIVKDNRVAYSSGKFVRNIEQKASPHQPTISATAAVFKAAEFLNLSMPIGLQIVSTNPATNTVTFNDASIAKEKIEAELMWASVDEFKTVQLSWNVNIDDLYSPDWWNLRLSADNGSYLEKNNWTISCNFSAKETKSAKHSSNKKAGFARNKSISVSSAKKVLNAFNTSSIHIFKTPPAPQTVTSANYLVVPFPADNKNVTAPTVETNPWLKAGVGNNATTYGWHYDGTTNYNTTRGNNVHAYDDSLNKNKPGRPDTSSTVEPVLTFNNTPTFNQEPTTPTNRKFNTDNLFYWNNIIHDVVYQYGFTEKAGNFQADNMGRGGVGNDYVKAEAQDGSGTNNANFSTPVDGGSGRMQMYLWTTATPKLDGDIDNGVVTHEFTHGISNRLTGGPNTGGCLSNKEQGGEGWSDYVALMLTTNWATALLTDGVKKKPMGTYVLGQALTGKGIRTYPYSTSLSIDPHTYANVSKNVGGNIGEVHYIGEIWTTALWDMTWYIIQQEGVINPNIYDANAAGGNSIALKLVMEGMKMQPCLPGFLDARNAILAADSILYNNKHKCAIWTAFARRGMGFSAVQGSSGSVTDQVVASDLPKGIIFTSNVRPFAVKPNTNIALSLNATCQCKFPTNNYTVKATLPAGFTFVGGTGTNITQTGNVVKFNPLNFTKANQTDTITLTVNANGVGCLIDSVLNDNRDNSTVGGFTSTALVGTNNWLPVSSLGHNSTNAWQGADDTLSVDFALVSNAFVPNNMTVLSFWHRYNFEHGYDGGIVELSTDGGSNWQAANNYIIANKYNTTIDVSAPLAGQTAFSGLSSDYKNTLLNLSSLAGISTKVRFRVATDVQNVNGDINDGWIVDEISLSKGCGGFIPLVAYDSVNNVLDSTAYPVFITPIPLPVKYVGFTAQALNKESLLRWSLGEEINTDKYIIERSKNATDWNAIGTKNALKANTNKEYAFYDESPLSGVNYYRIKAIDADGSFSYSPIRKVDFNKTTASIVISPNPAKSSVKVYFGNDVENATIKVFDVQGKLVLSSAATTTNGSVTLNTSELVNGVYTLTVSNDKGVNMNQRLVIAK